MGDLRVFLWRVYFTKLLNLKSKLDGLQSKVSPSEMIISSKIDSSASD